MKTRPLYMKRSSQQFADRTRRSGLAVVEFLVVGPILLLLLLALIEFGHLNLASHSLDNAAYEAARQAILPGASAERSTAAATDYLKTIGIDQATVSISPEHIRDTTAKVTVTVTIPLEQATWLTPRFLTAGQTLESSSSLLTERAPAAVPGILDGS